ncbi:MAG: sigma-70 family RNA polymerase sigma factor [Pyrinomonadaceae bacterium]|nr:sigma-70 family RNA polymerase sigma factor [Pyrinomonadaceae bacterium]MDQ3135244.1 sigma-70 family RNA polymerase sigma factor [Acidobacteriota bacterium]
MLLSKFCKKIKVEDFEAAALPHLDDVYRAARRLTRNRAEAEDLVQDVYLQAWQSFHRFEPGTNCRAWLFQILFYKLHHHRRKWFRLVRESESALENLAYEPPPPEHIRDVEILSALEKLLPVYRETILLIDVEEFSYRETGFILKVPVGTVMSRLSRGRKLLRTALVEVADSYGIKNVREKVGHG